MDGPQEYEVESVTRARVHDKKGKKITWRYYVKWKGYGWDESTWEPTDSFQGGSEHILESFWERVNTGGRDISDATAFKKGEELLVSGPPGRKSQKRKADPPKTKALPSPKDIPSFNGETISAPLLSPRKRRRMQLVPDDEWGYSKPKRRPSAGVLKDSEVSIRPRKRRRASSPGPRKSVPKRLPSAGDSQLDADGETDPDVVEVEDELMQVSAEDAEEDSARTRLPATTGGNLKGSKEHAFDDLEHFYTGNPIDIDQNTDEQAVTQKPKTQLRPQSPLPVTSPSPEGAAPQSQGPVSPAVSAYDPLFDTSPSRPPEAEKDPTIPHHRVRAAKPLVKLIDTTTLETTDNQSRISAKARLMSLHASVPSTSSSSGITAQRGWKPGPGRSSSGLITRNRSSLLTVSKGALKSVKGKFVSTTEIDQSDEIEDDLVSGDTSEKDKLQATSRNDEDVVDQGHQTTPNPQPENPPSGDELLRVAGLQVDPEPLPDYEDDAVAQPQEVETQASNVASVPGEEEPPNQSLAKTPEEPTTSDNVADTSRPVSEREQQTSSLPTDSNPVTSVVTPADEAVRKNIELAKEQLFPSTQASFDSFSTTQSSFRSTIFGPLYQGSAANCVPAAKNELSTTFKVILGDGVELPLVLKDSSEIKARISDILIGNSSGSKVALFYSVEDALAMVSTFKSDGTARVVLDPSAEATQQERFSTLLQRFQSSHTLIAPVGKEVCVLYSSENAGIAEKLEVPTRLRGLSSTLLISRASIENQLAYVGAIMKATAL